jgi:hypothetical protein
MLKMKDPSSGMTKNGYLQMRLLSQEAGLSIIQKTLKFATGKLLATIRLAIT